MIEERLRLGTIIERELTSLGYTLQKKLSPDKHQSSSPSHSRVWLAEYQNGEAPELRALKISSLLLLDDVGDPNFEKLDELTQREVDILQKIKHPRIPAFRGLHRIPFEDIAAINVLAIEYIPAPNLLERVNRGERLPEAEAKVLLEDVLSALDFVHTGLGEQVLHRDIKPSNILFDGKKAYLFDFNFSKIGDGTSASTVIDNYGYYPVDAYSGRQTPSQDLVALGNVVIAAGNALEIAEIRTKQGKNGLEAVDVDTLPYSSKFLRFLRKLTTPNPALRYQTAKQALDDLKRLGELTEEQLDEKLKSIVRSEGLTKLLAGLKKEDSWFEYHVPPHIRSTYDDDSLLTHLERVYKREQLVIDEPAEVEKYAQPHERVVKRGTTRSSDIKLPKGAKGKIIGFKDEKPVVQFPSSPYCNHSSGDFCGHLYHESGSLSLSMTINPLDLMIYQTGWRKKTALEQPIRGDSIALKSGFSVEYTGENLQTNEEVIPDGTEGIIADTDRGVESRKILNITWASHESLVTAQNKRWWYNCDGVSLVRPNTINFAKLYAECIESAQSPAKA